MKQAVVTGANGFVGRALSHRLIDLGYEVHGLVRSLDSCVDLDLPHLHELPFDHYEEIQNIKILEGADVVYHCAWPKFTGKEIANPTLQLSGTKTTCQLYEACQKRKVKKFVFVGTSNQYEVIDLLQRGETHPRATTVYAAAKATADVMCKAMSQQGETSFCTAALAMLFGPGGSPASLPQLVIQQLIDDVSPALIQGDKLYDLLYITDAVEALCLIGEKGISGVTYYVGHQDLCTFRELFTKIGEVVNPEIPLLFGKYPDSGGINYSRINLESLNKDTGFKCRSDFEASVHTTAEWLKRTNSL